MRWLVIVAVVACRTARPAEVPQTPNPFTTDSGGIVLDKQYLENIPEPRQFDEDSFFDPCVEITHCQYEALFGLWPRPLAIAGRYYIDGMYVESRGPAYRLP